MSSMDGSRKSGHKVGGNKGIARRRKEVRREEAEKRNARTPEDRRRITREGPIGKRKKRAERANFTQEAT